MEVPVHLEPVEAFSHEVGLNKPLRMLFTCNNIPSHLDSLRPVIVAAERAGHTVAVAAPQELNATIVDYGFEHVVAGREWIKQPAELGKAAPLWAARAGQPFFLRHMAGQPAVDSARDILAADWEPDIIVREGMEFGGVLAAEKSGVPSACIGTASYVPEAFSPKRMSKIFAGSRRKMNLPPDPTGVSAYPFYASLMPKTFDPQAEQIPNTRFYYDPSLAAQDEQASEWLAELSPDRPIIYACLGSAALSYGGLRKHAVRMMERMVGALSGVDGHTVVVSTGNTVEPEHFGTLPEHILVKDYVPQKLVLKQARLFVTHGGYKSFMESVMADTPMILLPLIGDAMYTARRAAENGGGLSVTGRVTASKILRSCAEVLANPAYEQAVSELRMQMTALPDLDTMINDLTVWANQ